MIRLSVNLNKIALLRNARTIDIPSVTHAATIVLNAGAHGITVHPRPDERHIRKSDVYDLAALLNKRPEAEFNIEGNPFHMMMDLVRAVRPHQCTLVPDDQDAFTSDHGWNLTRDGTHLQPVIAELRALGSRVSLFMDPIPEAMPRASALGADRIELYTEPYAKAFGTPHESRILNRYVEAAQAAQASGLGINAGHDLNLHNLPRFLQAMTCVIEVSIGHALTADALEFGLTETVHRYLKVLGEP
jgi:pyridoxine 5-phosphate synthase